MKVKPVHLFVLGFLATNCVQAMGVDEFLQKVQTQHRSIRSFQELGQAAEFRKQAADAELAAMLSLSSQYLDDQKQSGTMPSYIVTRNRVSSYSLGLQKKFTTGTTAAVNAQASQINVNALSAQVPSQQGFATSGLGVSFSQSLWKNFFGAATRRRQSIDLQSAKIEKSGYDLQMKKLLIEAEVSYWDFIFIQDELKQRQESFERAKKIETWIRRRVANGIGDQADLLGAQGLVAQRQLQLLLSKDEQTALRKKIGDLLELGESEKFPNLQGRLSEARALQQMVENFSEQRQIVRLDTYLSVLSEKAKLLGVEQAADSTKPDLQLFGSFSTNQNNAELSASLANIANPNTPTTQIGVSLNWMLDGEVKQAIRETARMEAMAASSKKQRELLESQTAWQELNRRHRELDQKIKAAQLLADLQNSKARVERTKLEKGRTVTSNVIVAEQDAAEAELGLTRMLAEQRKLEAQARMFVCLGESL